MKRCLDHGSFVVPNSLKLTQDEVKSILSKVRELVLEQTRNLEDESAPSEDDEVPATEDFPPLVSSTLTSNQSQIPQLQYGSHSTAGTRESPMEKETPQLARQEVPQRYAQQVPLPSSSSGRPHGMVLVTSPSQLQYSVKLPQTSIVDCRFSHHVSPPYMQPSHTTMSTDVSLSSISSQKHTEQRWPTHQEYVPSSSVYRVSQLEATAATHFSSEQQAMHVSYAQANAVHGVRETSQTDSHLHSPEFHLASYYDTLLPNMPSVYESSPQPSTGHALPRTVQQTEPVSHVQSVPHHLLEQVQDLTPLTDVLQGADSVFHDSDPQQMETTSVFQNQLLSQREAVNQTSESTFQPAPTIQQVESISRTSQFPTIQEPLSSSHLSHLPDQRQVNDQSHLPDQRQVNEQSCLPDTQQHIETFLHSDQYSHQQDMLPIISHSDSSLDRQQQQLERLGLEDVPEIQSPPPDVSHPYPIGDILTPDQFGGDEMRVSPDQSFSSQNLDTSVSPQMQHPVAVSTEQVAQGTYSIIYYIAIIIILYDLSSCLGMYSIGWS